MAAIDKIYVDTYVEYLQFKEWCKQQPLLKDKYGVCVSLCTYLYYYDEPFDGCHPIFNAPFYVDAYLIKNCPFDFIQEELMLNYGHWTQEKINDAYQFVMNRTEENKEVYSWLTPDDFEIVDGIITMPNKEKSDYELIKEGKVYNSPYTSQKYQIGKHFKCIKHPKHFYNRALKCKYWWVSVTPPDNMPYMWYHDKYKTWDFSDEFVAHGWSSSHETDTKTIKSLKRKLIKWKLPIGTEIIVTGRYLSDTYKFIITK